MGRAQRPPDTCDPNLATPVQLCLHMPMWSLSFIDAVARDLSSCIVRTFKRSKHVWPSVCCTQARTSHSQRARFAQAGKFTGVYTSILNWHWGHDFLRVLFFFLEKVHVFMGKCMALYHQKCSLLRWFPISMLSISLIQLATSVQANKWRTIFKSWVKMQFQVKLNIRKVE